MRCSNEEVQVTVVVVTRPIQQSKRFDLAPQAGPLRQNGLISRERLAYLGLSLACLSAAALLLVLVIK